MNTSYFAKYKGDNGVSIAIKAAPGFAGETYSPLYPNWSFLKQYKEDGDQQAYVKAYHEQILSKLDPQEVYNDLKGKTLLCWEKSGTFCHRRLVANWIKKHIGVTVPECL